MGADSPYAEGSKQELHFTQVLSVSSFVVQLLKYKRNLSNKPISEQQVSKPLSEK